MSQDPQQSAPQSASPSASPSVSQPVEHNAEQGVGRPAPTAVVVTAVFRPVPGALDAVLDVLGPVVTSVHDEPGCELYALHTDPDGSIVMIEKWSSAELLDQHGSAPAVAALGPALDGLLAAPPAVTRLVPVPVGGPAGAL